MTELESKSIYHQIQLERVENGIVKDCLLALEKANRMIASEIRKTGGVYTKERYKEIRAYLKSVAKELKKNLDTDMNVEDFIEYELESQIKLAKKYGGVQFVAPNKEQLITSATFAPYTPTSTFANYLDSFEFNYFNIWDSQVRSGYLTGMTTKQIVKNVMGYSAKDSQVANYGEINALRKSVEMNTRTALQSFAMETRKLVYEENKEVINGYKWLATLDRRTCIVCGEKEDKIYQSIKEIGDLPPLHFNCRCTIVPVVKGIEDLQDEGRASMNGVVDGNITFEEWLEKQPEKIQRDVLGDARYEMFKEGKPLGGFVKDNKILTLKQLQEQEL